MSKFYLRERKTLESMEVMHIDFYFVMYVFALFHLDNVCVPMRAVTAIKHSRLHIHCVQKKVSPLKILQYRE